MSTDLHLAAMERVADPLADDAVAAWMALPPPQEGSTPDSGAASRTLAASRLMAEWGCNADLAHWAPAAPPADPVVANALANYLAQGRALPDWVDPAKIERAEALFMNHGPAACTLLFCASLPECYVLPHLAEVLHIAGQLEAHTEHRIRQTAAMVFPVMMRGGLTGADGSGVAQVLKVRLIHATIRHLILHGNPGTVRGVVAPTPGNASGHAMHQALASHGWNVDRQGLPCNQVELAYTLLTFSYVFLRGMRKLHQGLSSADEEAYLHAWNVMGHLLGIDRSLMAHTMDDAAALFTRMQHRASEASADSSDANARPALGRALIDTMARSIRIPVIRHIPVPLTEWLIGQRTSTAIGVATRVSWLSRFAFKLGIGLTQGLDAVGRLVWKGFSLSRLLTRVVGYHLLTRFLLDQTRPLTLPERVLQPLHDTVASWSDDAAAPGWMRRLERRLTTPGRWLALKHRA